MDTTEKDTKKPGDDWDTMLYKLKNSHTLSFRGACRLLKCSRTWLNQYVMPHIKDTIYLSAGYGERKEGQPPKVNWLMMASIALYNDPGKLKDSIWMRRKDFNDLIFSHVVSCSRQTIALPVSYLISDTHKREAYLREIEAETKNFRNLLNKGALNRKDISLMLYGLSLIKTSYLPDWTKYAMPKCTARGKVSHVAVDFNDLMDIDIETWQAPHDCKGYGDSDEMVYREFFNDGCIRVEIQLPDEDGQVSKKIYYIKPRPLAKRMTSYDELVAFDYQQFCKNVPTK